MIKPARRQFELNVTPTSHDYVTLPIEDAFDWNTILDQVDTQRSIGVAALYLVVFRSTLRPGIDTELLMQHDQRAHDAALESPALIRYFGGIPNENGQALSFCLWENAVEAKAVSKDQRHIDATKMVSYYLDYSIERYDVGLSGGEVNFVAHNGRPQQ